MVGWWRPAQWVARLSWLVALLLLTECGSPSRDQLLEGKACREGDCAEGYRCDSTNTCVPKATAVCQDGMIQPGEECEPSIGTGVPCGEDCKLDCSLLGISSAELVIDGSLHCYHRAAAPRGWQDARAHCEDRGGYLATAHSEAEVEAIADAYRDLGESWMWPWLGASDGRGEEERDLGPMQWATSEPFSYSPGGGLDEPACTSPPCPHCLQLVVDMTSLGGLTVEVCGEMRTSICEWGPLRD